MKCEICGCDECSRGFVKRRRALSRYESVTGVPVRDCVCGTCNMMAMDGKPERAVHAIYCLKKFSAGLVVRADETEVARAIREGKKVSREIELQLLKMTEEMGVLTERQNRLNEFILKVSDNLYMERRRKADAVIGKQEVRGKIFARDGWSCLRCGSVVGLSIDHIIPVIKGGSNKDDNLQTLCKSCNSSKGGNI